MHEQEGGEYHLMVTALQLGEVRSDLMVGVFDAFFASSSSASERCLTIPIKCVDVFRVIDQPN